MCEGWRELIPKGWGPSWSKYYKKKDPGVYTVILYSGGCLSLRSTLGLEGVRFLN